jgi:hypothetical protein
MSFREMLFGRKKTPKEPEAIPVREKPKGPPLVVFPDGLCDLCHKTMAEHGGEDCRGNKLTFRGGPGA